jgi:hypothetical protein
MRPKWLVTIVLAVALLFLSRNELEVRLLPCGLWGEVLA